MLVDGQAGPEYDGVGDGSLLFSPDSKRVAYQAQNGGKSWMVVDGQKVGTDYDQASGLIFSPDGNRVAYVAQKGGKMLVIVDGQAGQKYNGEIGGFTLQSRQQTHSAYGAFDGQRWLYRRDRASGSGIQ